MEKIIKYIKLKDMKLWDDLDMEKVYEILMKNQSLISKPSLQIQNLFIKINERYKIQIIDIFINSITFQIKDLEFHNFFKTVLKYKLKLVDGTNIDTEIICIQQIKEIEDYYKFNKLMLSCHECNKFCSINIIDVYAHRTHKGVFLKEGIKLTKLTELEFNNFFKEKSGKIGAVFKPFDFEQNFKYYFKKCEFIQKDDEFKIYEDNSQQRYELIEMISFQNVSGRLTQFFGQPGKGKTVTLILYLKYMISHKDIGTLYLNCKALNERKNVIEIKELLLNEIPFLFYGDYEGYSKCVQILDNHYNKEDQTIYPIINKILDFLISKKSKSNFLIAFDQYNDKVDKDNNELNKLFEKLIIKNKKDFNFGLITFSSMNNRDIRKYKIESLDTTNYIRNNSEFKKIKIEIKNLEYDLSIDKGGIYDKYLKKLGSGLKYYNILNYYYSKKEKDNMLLLVEETKEHIKRNLKEFFNLDYDYSIINSFKFFTFTTDIEYSEIEFKKIKYNIPFKYFELKQSTQMKFNNEKENVIEQNEIALSNNNNIIIICSYELVEEAMDEIYLQIINTNSNLYNILTKDELDGGAKGKFFEKIITYYLNIESPIYRNMNEITFFDDFKISFHEQLNFLIPNKNEIIEKKNTKKILNYGVYLFSQKRYNGKAIDIALVNIREGYVEVIGIQVSIHKEIIIEINNIKKNLLKLKENIESNYELSINNDKLFFSYIFEYKAKDKYPDMLKKCNEKDIPYFFFDVTNKTFLDDSGSLVRYLTKKLIRPFSKMYYGSVKRKQNSINDWFKFNMSLFPLYRRNKQQNMSIIEIIKENTELKGEIYYEFLYSLELTSEDLEKKQNFYIGKTNSLGDIIMLINKKYYFIDSKGTYSLYENKDKNKLNNIKFDNYNFKEKK